MNTFKFQCELSYLINLIILLNTYSFDNVKFNVLFSGILRAHRELQGSAKSSQI